MIPIRKKETPPSQKSTPAHSQAPLPGLLSSAGLNPSLDKIRRKRTSNGTRNHVCGCNKEYLSYPALYTHVKIKHGGVFPSGSTSKKLLDPGNGASVADFDAETEKEEYINELTNYLNKVLNDNNEVDFSFLTTGTEILARTHIGRVSSSSIPQRRRVQTA